MASRLTEITPYLALGAAAGVPLVVVTSEKCGFGSSQLSKLLASTPWAVPAATACLDRLAALLTEASEALGGPAPPGSASAAEGQGPRTSFHQPAAAMLATSTHITHPARSHGPLAALPAMPSALPSAAAARLPAPQLLEDETDIVAPPAPAATPAPADKISGGRSAANVVTTGKVMRLSGEHRHQSAAMLTQQHTGVVEAMRQALRERHGAAVLPPRFTDAELMRFAISKGFLRAQTHDQRQHALQQGAAMAARTAAWLASHPFASEEELAAVGHLLRWDGVDAAGRPVLHIAIGRAVVECRGPAALGFANAIITQLQRAVEGMLGDDGSRPDRIVVVMDCSGCSPLSATRTASLFKAVCFCLNHHFPGRLHELVLLDLPGVLTWLVHGIKKLMHPDTREKVRLVRNGRDAPAALEAEG